MAILGPDELAKSGTEHGHQCAVMQWVALIGIKAHPLLWMLHAIPNGGGRSMSVGAAMKAEGVKRGVPDLCLPVPRAGYNGLYLEMKTPKAFEKKDHGCSEEQLEWHESLLGQGYVVVVCAGWQAACWALTLYLGSQLHMIPGDGSIKACAVDRPPFLRD